MRTLGSWSWCIHSTNMASTHIQALLAPPSLSDSQRKVLGTLDTRYKTFQDLEDDPNFDDFVEETRARNEDLKAKVRPDTSSLPIQVFISVP